MKKKTEIKNHFAVKLFLQKRTQKKNIKTLYKSKSLLTVKPNNPFL